ncbi:DinB family protein [Magnetospirillum sulfuroxidans]|uniref:DinB family protein n=1 Tax=Magnetospirillum sulfuroxidans TaxID=611300 RepID=A0ABS5IAL6_9PROT|nr:DinB family protein [Magnetospirillum sulfuroxidans]MBR9971470.1 DinB family protein [Magnetospirillum sulfuroxidans]
MTPATLRRLSRYNAWANQRLYAACGALDPAEFAGPRPSFFGSIMATLNHALVADMIWLGRFTDRYDHGITALDQILHDAFDPLARARAELDGVIIAHFDGPMGDLEAPFSYRTMAGGAAVTPLGLTMLHMFTHTTHHRGQVHDMLSATPTAPPVLDFVYYLRENP